MPIAKERQTKGITRVGSGTTRRALAQLRGEFEAFASRDGILFLNFLGFAQFGGPVAIGNSTGEAFGGG